MAVPPCVARTQQAAGPWWRWRWGRGAGAGRGWWSRAGAGGRGGGREGNAGDRPPASVTSVCFSRRVTGGELFEDIVAREYYSEADARWVCSPPPLLPSACPSRPPHPSGHVCSCDGGPARGQRRRQRRWTLPEQVTQWGGSCLLPPRGTGPELGSTQACQFPLGCEMATVGAALGVADGCGCPPARPHGTLLPAVGTLAAFPAADGAAGGARAASCPPGTPPRPRVGDGGMSGPSRGDPGQPSPGDEGTERLRDAACSGVTGPIPGSVASADWCVPCLWARCHPGL